MKILLNLALPICVLLAGCSKPPKSRNPYPDLMPIMSINIQDFQPAASDLVQKMLVHPDFAQYGTANKAQLHLSDFINNTGKAFDMDFLLSDVRSQLLRSGKFKISRLRGQAGTDEYAKRLAELIAFEKGKAVGRLPNYVLSGKISELRRFEKRTTQSTFKFTIIATDLVEGNSVFEDSKDITKQGKKSRVGF